MGARDKPRKGPPMIAETNKGGRSRTADMTLHPTQEQSWAGLPGLIGHVAKTCFDLKIEFEEFWQEHGVRMVDLEDFFQKLAEQVEGGNKVSDAHFCKYFDGTVIEPLRELYEKVRNLQAQISTQEETALRSLVRSAVGTEQARFDCMLLAFEKLIENLLALNAQDARNREAATAKLKEVNQAVGRGEDIKRRLLGCHVPGVPSSPGIESQLDTLVRQIRRELEDPDSPLHTTKALAARWAEVGELLELCQGEWKRFATAKEVYDSSQRAFFLEHDSIKLYKGDWQRQKSVVLAAEQFFKAAEINPFELSDTLVKLNREAVLTMPDQEERAAVESSMPNAFPELTESRVEERARKVIEDIETASQTLNKPAPKPPPVVTCPIMLSELALCTYATIVARYSNGKPYPTSGRTTRKVHEALLTPAGLTYGCTDDQFKEACKEGERVGWLQSFKRVARAGKVWYICYQPTVNGFALAEKLLAKLPADFCDLIMKQNEVLRAASEQIRKEFSARKRKRE